MAHSAPELLTPTQAAGSLGIGKLRAKWLASEALAGRLPHVNCGGVPLFDLDALRAALTEQARSPITNRQGTNA